MKKLLLVAVALFIGYTIINFHNKASINNEPLSISENLTENSDAIIASAFSNRENSIQVSGQGSVIILLGDDNDGSRHQRFIIKLSSGHTLLIAHNIDLAPRINSLREGDLIQFYGEYEWNDKGGGIHWTHRDPNDSHAGGWLQHQGQRYQ